MMYLRTAVGWESDWSACLSVTERALAMLFFPFTSEFIPGFSPVDVPLIRLTLEK